eukprot:2219173-Pyramimonas_sp.AAC.1
MAQWSANVRQAAAISRDGRLRSGLVRAYLGASPALVAELCECAKVDPAASPDSLGAEQWAALHRQWRRWLQVRAGHGR